MAGKSIVSRNSTRHGIWSSQLLLPGENSRLLESLRKSIVMAIKPRNAVEALLVERIIVNTWRLRRILRIEQSLFEGELRPLELLETLQGRQLENYVQSTHAHEVLSKYETALERGIYRALRELERLRGGVANPNAGERLLNIS